MFTIIGGDGQEYGPVSVEQLRTWITSGRANLETRARKDGETTWRRLGDFAEFASQAGAPPVMGGTPAVDSQLGSRWARLGAAFVDGLLVLACYIPMGLAVSKWAAENMQPGSRPDMMAMGTVVQSSMSLAYPYLGALFVLQGILVGMRSQSVGKILLSLRIVRAPDGSKATFVRAFLVRTCVPTLIGFIPILGGLFSLVDICFIFRSDKRCVHDLMAGTKVNKA